MAEKEENEREDWYKGERHGQKVEAKEYSDNLKMGVGGRKVYCASDLVGQNKTKHARTAGLLKKRSSVLDISKLKGLWRCLVPITKYFINELRIVQ